MRFLFLQVSDETACVQGKETTRGRYSQVLQAMQATEDMAGERADRAVLQPPAKRKMRQRWNACGGCNQGIGDQQPSDQEFVLVTLFFPTTPLSFPPLESNCYSDSTALWIVSEKTKVARVKNTRNREDNRVSVREGFPWRKFCQGPSVLDQGDLFYEVSP